MCDIMIYTIYKNYSDAIIDSLWDPDDIPGRDCVISCQIWIFQGHFWID